MNTAHVIHPLAPVFDGQSRILILGTMPSPRSRQAGFYYMHPQNRFWPVMQLVFGDPLRTQNDAGDEAVQERKAFALRHRVALWDVLQSCDIHGAGDSSIRRPVANDIAWLLAQTQIEAIYCTGRTAHAYYTRLCEPHTGRPARYLPSTSPANQARWPLAQLVEAYRVLAAATC